MKVFLEPKMFDYGGSGTSASIYLKSTTDNLSIPFEIYHFGGCLQLA